MKRLLPVLMGCALLLLSSTEGWSLPPCPGSPTSSWSTISNWTDCFGTRTYANGDKYVGEWKDGWQHGQGTLTLTSGNKYVGEWKDGWQHGQGTATYPDGSNYVGEWKDDIYHGQGTATYADGSKYVGEWKDDIYHGQGTFTFADGRIKEGIWKKNKFLYSLPPCPGSPTFSWFIIRNWTDCYGTETFVFGDKYVGEFTDGRKHGQGTYTWADGTVDEGIWEYGKLKKRK